MIVVCVVGKKGECYRFANSKIDKALAFARIGSQHGRPRRVSVCGRLARVYSNGIKAKGGRHITELRSRARSCG